MEKTTYMNSEQSVLRVSQVAVARGASFRLRIPILNVRSGRVTCIVGANGCGKTTLLETVVGLSRPQKGTITIGQNSLLSVQQRPHLKRAIGYIPDDEAWLIPELTAREYIALHAALFAKAGVRYDTTAEALRLAHILQFVQPNQMLGSLSHGNKKKVQIIVALMHKPQLIIVDELRNGLDPLAIKQAEDILDAQKKNGAAILAATHDLWWAERFADDIVMLQNGRMLLHAATADIIAESGSVESKFMELYQRG